MASEKKVQNDSLVGCSAVPFTFCWRNNTGMAWQANEVVKRPIGSMVRVEPGMVILRDARPVTFGLPGSGDVLGVTLDQSTGRGVPWSLEIKATTKQTLQQRNFEAAWTKVGGIYRVSRSVEDSVAVPKSIRLGSL